MNKKIMINIVCVVVVLLLQLIVSPSLPIGGTTLNFCLAYVVAISLALRENPKIILCVLLGIIMDLTHGGPVGAFTLIFLLINATCVSVSANITSSGTLEKSVIAFVACAVANLLHCLIVGVATPGISLITAFTSGALWSLIFDGVISVLFLLILSKILVDDSRDAWKSSF